ncbi:MAG: Hsp70 family protein, partial [Nakamurella sp.]
MGYVLGVDLGTTFTAAATYDRADGQARMLGLGNRALQVPSVLYRQPDGQFLVGEAAVRRGLTDPVNVAREFKRRIGDHVPIIIGGSPYSAQSLTARLLRWVVEQATERMGAPPDAITLTHPANWAAFKLDLLRQAAQLADLPAVRMCSEPEAAAQEYASKSPLRPGDRICVYDLGGGTFDAAVLSRTPTGFATLGTPEGIEHLGGIDFDEAVFEYVLDETGADISDPDPAHTAALLRLRSDCAEAKEALSTDVETTVTVNLPGTPPRSVRLTRAGLEDMIRPAIADTITATNRALRSAGTAPTDLAAVVLVGGSSRIPLVTETLTHAYQRLVARNTHPKHDIALGAARTGQPTGPVPAPGGPAGPSGSAPDATPNARRALTVDSLTPAGAGDPGAGTTEPTGRPWWRRPGLVSAGAVVVVIAVVSAILLIPSPGADPGAAAGGDRPLTSAAPSDPVGQSTSPTDAASSTDPSSGSSAPSSGGTTSAAPDPDQAIYLPSGTIELPRSAALSELFVVFPRYVKERAELVLINRAAGSAGTQLTQNGGAGPVISPDRQSLIYVNGNNLRVMAVDGSGERQLFANPPDCAQILRPAWNPGDPDVIAIVCVDPAGKYSLRRIRVDGTDSRTVAVPADGIERLEDLSYAPDGRTLTFWAGKNNSRGGGAIYTMADDGTELHKLTDGDLEDTDADPMFSPDGTRIAFRRLVLDNGVASGHDIYLMPSDGSQPPSLLLGGPDSDQDPTWSPLGTFIVFKSNRDFNGKTGEQHLWVVPAAGGAAQPLTPTDMAQA